MTYTKLLEDVKKLVIEEIRADSSEMLEFAIRTDYLNQLNGVLGKHSIAKRVTPY
jgi:hypothetical protein